MWRHHAIEVVGGADEHNNDQHRQSNTQKFLQTTAILRTDKFLFEIFITKEEEMKWKSVVTFRINPSLWKVRINFVDAHSQAPTWTRFANEICNLVSQFRTESNW